MTNFFIKILKKQEKKLALTQFIVIREVWLGNSKMFTCIDQSRFYIFSHSQINFCKNDLQKAKQNSRMFSETNYATNIIFANDHYGQDDD